jgi:hypothetical protein
MRPVNRTRALARCAQAATGEQLAQLSNELASVNRQLYSDREKLYKRRLVPSRATRTQAPAHRYESCSGPKHTHTPPCLSPRHPQAGAGRRQGAAQCRGAGGLAWRRPAAAGQQHAEGRAALVADSAVQRGVRARHQAVEKPSHGGRGAPDHHWPCCLLPARCSLRCCRTRLVRRSAAATSRRCRTARASAPPTRPAGGRPRWRCRSRPTPFSATACCGAAWATRARVCRPRTATSRGGTRRTS